MPAVMHPSLHEPDFGTLASQICEVSSVGSRRCTSHQKHPRSQSRGHHLSPSAAPSEDECTNFLRHRRLTKPRCLHKSLDDHGQQALIVPVLLRQAQPDVTLAAARLYRPPLDVHARKSTDLKYFSLSLLPFEPGAIQVFVPQSDGMKSPGSHDCTSNL